MFNLAVSVYCIANMKRIKSFMLLMLCIVVMWMFQTHSEQVNNFSQLCERNFKDYQHRNRYIMKLNER